MDRAFVDKLCDKYTMRLESYSKDRVVLNHGGNDSVILTSGFTNEKLEEFVKGIAQRKKRD